MGRIPEKLEQNEPVIYYGNHQSAASVIASGDELAKRIKEIVQESGCEKLNIIAHSKKHSMNQQQWIFCFTQLLFFSNSI